MCFQPQAPLAAPHSCFHLDTNSSSAQKQHCSVKAASGTFGFYLENVSHPTQQNTDQPLKLQLSAGDGGELHEEREEKSTLHMGRIRYITTSPRVKSLAQPCGM